MNDRGNARVPDWATHREALLADLDRVAARDRWGRALMAMGWIHLAAFAGCEAMQLADRFPDGAYVLVWAVEFASVLLAWRLIAGRGWYRATPMGGMLVRVWGTFLILSFNLASLNNLTGFTVDWFKPALATLSSFGFMIMAYLVSLRFFWFAVLMYFTGLLMATLPDYNYAIYGISWWTALQGLGFWLEGRRRRAVGFGAPGASMETSRRREPVALGERV